MIEIGKYIESAVEWLTEHGAAFLTCWVWQWKESLTGSCMSCLECPFISPLQSSPLWHGIKSGRGTGLFTLLGLSLVYGMGLWEETMQTLALVLSSTGMALLLGIPLGSGWRAADVATKSCCRYLIVCRLC